MSTKVPTYGTNAHSTLALGAFASASVAAVRIAMISVAAPMHSAGLSVAARMCSAGLSVARVCGVVICAAWVSGAAAGCSSSKAPAGGAAQKAPPKKSAEAPTKGPRFGTVRVHAGFAPDPQVVAGTSGGEVEASTLEPKCKGWIAQAADVVLEARDAFADLRVMAHGEGEVMLVLKAPNGEVRCTEDGEGPRTSDPLLRLPVEPGAYEVWVGSSARGKAVRYTLAFSELADMVPAKLPR